MKASLAMVCVGFSLALCASCAVDDPVAVDTAGEPTTSTSAQSIGERTEPADVTPASAVWHYVGTELCDDYFSGACSPWYPTNQCSFAVEGQPCSYTGWCAKVLPGNYLFDFYYCN
jgi:hypothetical protein